MNTYKLLFLIICAAAFMTAQEVLPAEPLSRAEAIRIALEHNPDIAAARNEWEASQARVTQEKAFADPEFEIEYEEVPGGMKLGDYGERNVGFVQEIEYPMKWYYRLKAVKHASDATKFAVYETAKLDVTYTVKAAYDNVLAKSKILEYERTNRELLGEFYEKAKLRYESGAVSNLEILRADVERGRAENRVKLAESEFAVAKSELNTLLAREGNETVEPADEFRYERIELPEAALKQAALENRPDYLGAALTVKSLKASKSEMKSALVPDLNIGMFRQTISEPLNKEKYWHVSLALEIPLWGLYRQRGILNEASAEIRKETSNQTSLRSNIMLEIESALHEFNTARDMMDLFTGKILDSAERSYDAAFRSYEEGKATYLELMDARRALTETRIEYTETLYNYRLSVINLERAIGADIASISQEIGR